MADGGFEAYFHVPQQSRRDKLRDFMAQNHPNHHPLDSPRGPQRQPLHQLQGCSGLFPPLYDHPSIFPFPATNYYFASTSTSQNIIPPSSSPMDGLGSVVTVPPSSTSSSSPAASYLDCSQVVQVPPSYLVNPISLPANSNDTFVYSPQNLGQGSGLSLSLSSHYSNSNPRYHQTHASTLPSELDLRRYVGGPTVNYDEKNVTWSGEYVAANPSGSSSYEASRIPVPLGPFTGYAFILRGSKYLKPAQELLEQLLSDGSERKDDHRESSLDISAMDPPDDHCLTIGVGIGDDPCNGRRKSMLFSLLEEVCKIYRQLYQQIQAVASSFDCIAGLGYATPYANLALKALSRHFKAVKLAITDQLQYANKSLGQVNNAKGDLAKVGHLDRDPCDQKSMSSSGFIEQRPVWRPQRGLPDRAVAVLRSWLFDHFLHPYPTDTDKMMLANQTGLSRNQVSNWFINARVRLWKPMVEEIHTLESRQAPDSRIDELIVNRTSGRVQPSNFMTPSHSSARKRAVHDVPLVKYSTVELPDLPDGAGEQSNYELTSQSRAGMVANSAISSGRVSLTLGLHHNTNAALALEPHPVAEARRIGLGLDANAQGSVMGNLESLNQQRFGRDANGSQLFG